MALKYKFERAEKIISKLSPDELRMLEKICKEIQVAEEKLFKAAEEILKRCEDVCEGLCCRNTQLDSIISLWDFIYLLTLENSMRGRISECLQEENIFYSSDCIFLENGTGPCLFPPAARPEVCITTFCSDEKTIKKEINLVKLKFIKLSWFILLRKPRALKHFLSGIFKGKE
ncbi:MAG TPA: hypothetical protein ENK58_00600 [Desulfobacterales bacterium]|nr:hypothetical protein [Desulfobacterales bacterium]